MLDLLSKFSLGFFSISSLILFREALCLLRSVPFCIVGQHITVFDCWCIPHQSRCDTIPDYTRRIS